MTFTVCQPLGGPTITYELTRPLTAAESYVVNILLYKPTNMVVAISRPTEERLAESSEPIIGALLEQWGAARRIE